MRALSFILILHVLGVAAQAQTLQTHLEYLDDMDEFTSIEEALLNPDSVYRLNLRGKKLKQVPPQVFTSFPYLVDLDLSRNRLKELPDSLWALGRVKRLNLCKNQIEQLPPSIGRMHHLEELVISQNELTALPDSLGQLERLRMIDAWSNNFDELPASMGGMRALEVMDLRVIMMHYDKQERITELLPNVKVYMSEGCNCN
jgi:Leucine-rich repeat (LRR) protein